MMSDKYASNTIKKPAKQTTNIVNVIDNITSDYCSKGYCPLGIIGITFGVDLSKWRDILGTLFQKKYGSIVFNERKKFDSAILISDPVSIKDKDNRSFLDSDNLRIYIRGDGGSYLHTKIILINFAELNNPSNHKFSIIVSSKNISYSGNYDIVTCLESDVDDELSESESRHGKILFDYISFLLKDENLVAEYKEKYSKLQSCNFRFHDNENEFPSHINRFEISYEKKRFSDEIWKRVLSADRVISPYLSEAMFKEWVSSPTSPKRILTYRESIDKLHLTKAYFDEHDLRIFVGKPSQDSGRNKFHSKIYIFLERKSDDINHTVIVFGSANLTDEARNKHCEMLIEVEYDDDGEIYKWIGENVLTPGNSGEYNNSLIEKYDSASGFFEIEFDDDESDQKQINRMSKCALFYINGRYEWHIYGKQDEIITVQKDKIGHWIQFESSEESLQEIYVCKENYQSFQNEPEGYNTYEDFIKLTRVNLDKQKKRAYENILIGKKSVGEEKKKAGRPRKNNISKHYRKYPCLYRTLIENGEKEAKTGIQNIVDRYIDENDTDLEIVKLINQFLD